MTNLRQQTRNKVVAILGYPKATTKNLVKIDQIMQLLDEYVESILPEKYDVKDKKLEDGFEHDVGWNSAIDDIRKKHRGTR